MEIPKFESYEEELELRFQKIGEALKNLAARTERSEQFISRGADMIQYKIPGEEGYSNLRQIFDTIFDRLNKLEAKLDD